MVAEFASVRKTMRTGFTRLIGRQDSHFRWLAGPPAGSAIALGSMLYMALH